MSVFAELGLREDADESDVKRAYARRLRAVRPDEDAEGFQALNTAYKAALAAARWRAQAAADAVAAAPETAAPSFETSHAEVIEKTVAPEPIVADAHVVQDAHVVDEPVDAESAPIDVPETLFEYASTTDTGAIAFDFDAFSRDLFAATAEPTPEFRSWLAARMATWPIAMKPTLAPYMLQALDDEDVAVSPHQFEVIVEAFGLDDVLSGIDAVAIAQLRAANEVRFTKRSAVVRARGLLAPENKRALNEVAVTVGGYPSHVAPLLAWLVTGPRAAQRTALRWVPSLSTWVLNLLRYLSAGQVDALSPPIEPHVLQRWQGAESIIGWLKLKYVAFALCVLVGLWVGISNALKTDEEYLADQRLGAIWQEEEPQPQKAVDDYAALIAAHPPPRSVPLERTVVTAMFNKNVVLAKMGRTAEAEAGYRHIVETFDDSFIPYIRVEVGKALNNWANLLGRRGDYRAMLPLTGKVIARSQDAKDEDQGSDSLEVQYAKAVINQTNALEHLGDRTATLALCRDFLQRTAWAQSDEMKDLIATVHDIEGDYGVRTVVPQTPVAPPGVFVPSESATPVSPNAAASPRQP